ncbi:hypothetical protein AB0C10_02920 [Microbispora amethystogenes]|uniref:hypothetical protein n=1 Tax=Microbispora amethystogenes TaxID=1427754 RepID=UPI0033C8B9C3
MTHRPNRSTNRSPNRSPWTAVLTVALAVLATSCGASPPAVSDSPPPDPALAASPAPSQAALAEYRAAGDSWRLVAFTGDQGGHCLSVEGTAHEGLPECDFEVTEDAPVNAAIWAIDDQDLVVYGRVAPETVRLYAVQRAGRVPQALHRDPISGEVYFATFIRDRDIRDIVAVSADGRRHGYTKKIEDFLGHDE